MAANKTKGFVAGLLLILLSGCIAQTQPVVKIALLAPFEGRYRDIGYQALYAARLALAESNTPHVHLLAIDDGGSIATAKDRAQAIQNDPTTAITLALGPFATAPDVQQEFTNTPLVIVGHWKTQPVTENAYQLTTPAITPHLTLPDNTDIITAAQTATDTGITTFIGDEMLSLESFALLLEAISPEENADIRIFSTALLPDEDFSARYQAVDNFAPEPGLLAPLTYDAARLAVQSITENTPLNAIQYKGYHGTIAFDDAGFWQTPIIYAYIYNDTATLLPLP
jgi:hypothetical protein